MHVETECLKHDAMGRILRCREGARTWIRREVSVVRAWLRPLARHAMRREARALERLGGFDGVPALLRVEVDALERSHLPGAPLSASRPSPEWFRRARRLLRRLHDHGIAHNDLAKEENWLVLDYGGAGLIDFQLAVAGRLRAPWFRLMAREDLRHLVKHKRTYHPDRLTASERGLLRRRSLFARVWRHTVKRAYNLLTRRLLGVRDREGQGLRPRGSARETTR